MNASPTLKDRVFLAVAGAGKTTQVAKNILTTPMTKRIAVISYANKAVASIREKISENNCGVIPSKVDIYTWFGFVYHECVLPYQKALFSDADIRGMSFEQEDKNATQYNPFKKTDIRRYVTKGGNLKHKEAMDFVMECIKKGSGLVTRLSEIYEEIVIDEAQDLAHDDLDLIESLMKSSIRVTLVGDSRQATFTTHNGVRNKKYKGANIIDYFKELQAKQKIELIEWNDCWRSNRTICSFADRMFPNLSSANSIMTEITGHDGVFLILSDDIEKYIGFLSAFQGSHEFLKYNATTKVPYRTCNFGECKGLTFDRTILFANNPLEKYVATFVCDSPAKYYVALTRARYSVAIVVKSFPKTGCYKDRILCVDKEHFTIKEYIV